MNRTLTAFLYGALLSFGASWAGAADGVFAPQLPLPPTQTQPKGVYQDPLPKPKDDPHVPWDTRTDFASQNYFSLGENPRAGDLIILVENVHMGPQNNPRGFWKHFYAGEFDYALEQLKYVLWVFPNHPVALHMLGVMARKMGTPTIPIAYYEKAIRLFPDVPYTHAQYGAYFVDTGDVVQGMMELRKALDLDPNLVQARAWLARANAEISVSTKR